MDSRIEIMVSLGAAIGANCIPCFDHLYEAAQEHDITNEDIQKIVELGTKVKNGASIVMRKAADEVLGMTTRSNTEQTKEPCCCDDNNACC